ncbi:hypothetical protein CEXT_248511 [Caerostris extrusa]|uniref:Uncharacterized protein n=1 Tax=Caerostris extrusa TaxID=172846 RepID=A0AAV4ME86_CAEEX|nr:hypothetical protein CEXT_248511 [Caerostris extrusa]
MNRARTPFLKESGNLSQRQSLFPTYPGQPENRQTSAKAPWDAYPGSRAQGPGFLGPGPQGSVPGPGKRGISHGLSLLRKSKLSKTEKVFRSSVK